MTILHAMDIPLRCQCGLVRGTATDLSPDAGNRIVCLCDDCQAYACFLDREDVLDRYGGTDIFQTVPSRVRITQGMEHVRCMRLSEKGLFRWYASCCRTPIGNTLGSGRVAFVGLVHTFMDHTAHGQSRDEALGKPLAWIQGKFAFGGLPAHAHPTAPLSLILRSIRGILIAAVKERPVRSPFFDARSHRPIVEPMVLAAPERERLRKRVAELVARGPVTSTRDRDSR